MSLQIPSHFKFQTRSDLTVPSKALENASVVNREYGGIDAKPVSWVLDEMFFAYFHQLQIDQHIFSTDLELGCGLGRNWQELGIGSFSGDSLKLAKLVMDKN